MNLCMKSFCAFLILICVLPAHAVFVSGSLGVRYENEGEGTEMKTRQPYGFVVGHRIKAFTLTGEYATFFERTGNPTLSIERQQQMGLLGVRFHFLDPDDVFTWYPYFSAGLGAYREIVTTEFMGMSSRDISVWRPVVTLGVGFWGELLTNVRVGSELRAMSSKEFNPQTLLDLGLRLGYQFD